MSDDDLFDQLRHFINRELPLHQAEWGATTSFDARASWQRRLATEQFVGLSWPQQHGGRGLPIDLRLRCEQQLALAGAPTPAGTLGLNNVGPTLIAFGTPEQQRHLKPILDTSEIWCQGFSEPDAGSDLASLRTAARATDDGFSVTGRKVWTTNGLQATHCLVLARSDPSAPPHRGISAFLVALDHPGIDRRPILQMDGGADFAELTFDDVRVGPEAVLGPLHEGWRVTMTTLSSERAGVISEAPLLERDIMREIRCLPAASRATLVDEFVGVLIEARILGFLGAQALAGLSRGEQPGPRHTLIRLAQSSLRQQLAEARFHAGGMAVVAGLAPETERALLNSRSTTIAAGTREILKNVVAERVLGLPKG